MYSYGRKGFSRVLVAHHKWCSIIQTYERQNVICARNIMGLWGFFIHGFMECHFNDNNLGKEWMNFYDILIAIESGALQLPSLGQKEGPQLTWFLF